MTDFSKVSIVVPIFNEERTIRQVIERIETADTCGLEKEIILVNDGSSDKTQEILNTYKNRFKICSYSKNLGKGAALKAGFGLISGDIVIIQDADLEYSPEEYKILIAPILHGEADVVFGSRLLTDRPHRVLYFWHSIFNKWITVFSNMLTNLNLSDMETGYKVFTKRILDNVSPKLESKRFGFEPEFTARIAKLAKAGKCKIFEMGISYHGRTYKEGKKIGFKDGIETLYCIIKYNLFST
jgi:glycosyltransferase involved in cell wall biosynthesis